MLGFWFDQLGVKVVTFGVVVTRGGPGLGGRKEVKLNVLFECVKF